MKILQGVTLVTPDGAYGGPVRVAVNQSNELRRRGHDVELVGGCRGFGAAVPESIDGIPARLFPAGPLIPGAGFGTFFAPRLVAWLRQHAGDFDVAHVHLARDFVTPLIARSVRGAGVPYVVQPHGMLRARHSLPFRLFDSAFIRRTLASSAAVFYLTPDEREQLAEVGVPDPLLRALPNGVPGSERIELSLAGTPPLNVLYLSRIHPRKRPELFAAAARELTREFGERVTFSMVGPDEGGLGAVDDVLDRDREREFLTIEGPLAPEHTLDRMARSDIFVLPSIAEPFPMAVLEAMSLGKPVVITSSCGLAPVVKEFGAGIVIDERTESLAPAIRRLIANHDERLLMGANALRATRERFSMTIVADSLADAYTRASRHD